MGRLLSRMTARGALAQIRHVHPVRPGAARGLVAEVYAQVERDFGMLAPPLALHSPAPPALAACWLLLRESLLASGAAGRAAKEQVAMEVSAGNACPYCVDVHGATLRALPRPTGTPGTPGAPGRPGVPTAAGVTTEGAAGAELSAEASVTTAAAAERPDAGTELAAVAMTFHYLNRMVNVFLGDSPLPPELPKGARGPALRLFGALMRPAAARPVPPGAALGLLPAAPPPGDLAWTARVPRLGHAFGAAAAAIEAGGERRLPTAVRELVTEQVAAWDGDPPGPGRDWAGQAAAALPPAQRPAALLTLLTALASYQVDRRVVGEFLATTPDGDGEAALIEATAWAALTAARRRSGHSRDRTDANNSRTKGTRT
ncbi:carboxymuconolactone decarboxylase family protein [Nonomuraea sp. MG754425]|uniref:carboxymuconolactone decarboxylase family protein n=1 Tax=Nonomuraea sp. MG754425 TaxID=2570319 RepID=UPI0023510CD3|nr:carboxymuconolactone decarboxylase family protein [Nonomuraea sp. MG754425]MCF6474895.1 carboxymuconolactone decarboxylase family protein [Nonomuraea sp. MG754425]